MTIRDALQKRKQAGCIPVVPDIKCFSPKDGDLMRGRDPVMIAKTLEAAGAPALSVVTEEKEFRGSVELLRAVCKTVSVPVLRKDFIETEKDLEETAAAGASAILLMVSCLGREKLTRLYHAAGELGLMPLVETHTKAELDFAAALGAPFVGINNRSILELERDDGDVSLTAGLLAGADRLPDAFVIAESAMKDAADVRTAVRSGADAALVGTALLQAEDPALLYRAMCRQQELKICGVMNREDVGLCLKYYAEQIGFVCEYPVEVPWDIPRQLVKELIAQAKGSAQTCVVTGGSEEKILSLAKEARPDLIQVHYTETLEETVRIAERLHAEGIRVIRSIPGSGGLRRQMFGTDSVHEIIRLLSGSPVDVILLDSRDAGNAASGGGSIAEDLSAEVRQALAETSKTVMIGGGITDQNAAAVRQLLPADVIDVMTGTEDRPGQKSEEKIAALTAAMIQEV